MINLFLKNIVALRPSLGNFCNRVLRTLDALFANQTAWLLILINWSFGANTHNARHTVGCWQYWKCKSFNWINSLLELFTFRAMFKMKWNSRETDRDSPTAFIVDHLFSLLVGFNWVELYIHIVSFRVQIRLFQ